MLDSFDKAVRRAVEGGNGSARCETARIDSWASTIDDKVATVGGLS
jgi:hypothetical protein